jgi:hypothetical protein
VGDFLWCLYCLLCQSKYCKLRLQAQEFILQYFLSLFPLIQAFHRRFVIHLAESAAVSPKGPRSSYDPAGKFPRPRYKHTVHNILVLVLDIHPRIGLPLYRRIIYIILQRHATQGGGRPASNTNMQGLFSQTPYKPADPDSAAGAYCTSASFRKESCSEGNISIGLLVRKDGRSRSENQAEYFHSFFSYFF